MASQEIFVIVWIVVYVFKIRGRVLHGWVICGDLRYVQTVSFFTYFKKRNKTNGFTVLCISILFKFEISCLCESFFKFNANLVMFTTINIYETILNKYYVHHIFKICIFTGMTATTKFVLCQLGST